MAARETIGDYKKGDRLNTDSIGESLPPEAAELREILGSAEVEGANKTRRDSSEWARSYKDQSRILAAVIVGGSGIAALASGLLLYGQERTDAAVAGGLLNFATKYQLGIIIVQIVALLAATAATTIVSGRDYGRLWTEARRKAELGRIEIMNGIFAKVQGQPGAGPDSLLAQFFQLFVRYQLDLQIAYYETEAKGAERSSTFWLYLSAAFSGLAAVIGLIGGLSIPGALVLAAFLGVATPIVLSALQSWVTATQPEAKAASYRSAEEELRRLRRGLDTVRAAAAGGDTAEVKIFVDTTQAIMAAENGEFVGLGKLKLPTDE